MTGTKKCFSAPPNMLFSGTILIVVNNAWRKNVYEKKSMKIVSACALTAGALMTCLTNAGVARAGTIELDPGPIFNYLPVGSDGSGGWSFTTNQAITVDALDDWVYTVANTPGLQVRLYGANQATITSATLTTADATEATASGFQLYTQPITPVTLSADATYYIASDLVPAASGGGYIAVMNGPVTTDPSITYGYGVLTNGTDQNPTTDIFSGGANPAYFGPDFDIATPEPASLAVLGLGAVGLLLKRKKSRIKVNTL